MFRAVGRAGSRSAAASLPLAAPGSPITAVARYAGHLDLVHGRHRQSRLQLLVGSARPAGRAGSLSVTSSADPALSSMWYRDIPIISTSSLRLRMARSCLRGGMPAPGGAHGSRFRAGWQPQAQRSRRSHAILFISMCLPWAPITASIVAGGTSAPAGPHGSASAIKAAVLIRR